MTSLISTLRRTGQSATESDRYVGSAGPEISDEVRAHHERKFGEVYDGEHALVYTLRPEDEGTINKTVFWLYSLDPFLP